ncbi:MULTISPECIES: LysE family translocator [Tsukamurella]|uniref:LysE family transporter n=1 Tax=Tsukamurella columbiensis TaxID=128509 RepID=A0ABX1LCF6_9ACTN|nr:MULTISPECIES: LysE family transporter [Tsukamurella]NMD55862.1 LysE family transporter [Tsukamurella columbiensis]
MGPSALAGAFGAGIVAGLGAVLPLGAIGILLLNEGSSRGWRRAVPAALGVGVADLLFAIVALAAGTVVAPIVEGWEPWPSIIGGVLLLVVAVVLARQARRPAPKDDDSDSSRGGRGLARFGMFFALTVVNPFPLVYFGAIAVGFGESLSRVPVATAFALGVGIASVGWNLVLLSFGAVLRARSTDRIQRIVTAVGAAISAVAGVVVLVLAFV